MLYTVRFLLFAVCLGFADQAGAMDTAVEFFSPQGTVKNVRQVTARFATAMVRFGDPRSESPFSVDCPANGAGRWVDGRNWAYDFEQDLPAGLRCSFKLKPGLKNLAGEPLTLPTPFSFDTGGPNIISSLPGDGDERIDESPIFVLKLDAPVQPESLLNARCEVEGLGETIETNLISGEARQQFFNSGIKNVEPYFFENTPDNLLLLLQCRRSFPPESKVRLVWGAGIASPAGITTVTDQVLNFVVRPAFSARFQCDRVNADAHCIPFLPFNLIFSSAIPSTLANQIKLLDEKGESYPAEAIDPAKQTSVERLTFKGPFPELANFKIQLPEGLKDDAGRVLENAKQFPLTVKTDEYPPLAKFNGEFGILEWKVGGVLPVTLRNVEAPVAAQQASPGQTGIPGQMQRMDQDDKTIAQWLRKVKSAAYERFEPLPHNATDEEIKFRNRTGVASVFSSIDKAENFALPKPLGEKTFEVMGIPLKKPGFYVVELASPRLGKALLNENIPRYVATSALVTNLSVHFKWGRESSLVWVTQLDSAQPVADAEIRITNFCTGQEYWHGRTGPDGTATIQGAQTLPAVDSSTDCYESSSDQHPLMISARTPEDMSFVVSGWNKGINPYDFRLEVGSASQSEVAHAVLDRTLFRAGETASMKFYLRRRSSEGFAAYSGAVPDKAKIRHVGSGETFEVSLAFDQTGIAEARFEIPKEAKLGVYEVSLYHEDDYIADTSSFRVEQFRIPTMKATVQPTSDYLVNAKEAKVDLFVGYLSGGGAGLMPVKLRSQVQAKIVSFPEYEDFSFGGADIKAGMTEETQDEEEPSSPAQVLPLTLDKAGAARATIPGLPKFNTPKDVLAELEYQDANGQLLSVARHIPLWPAAIALGLKQEGWVASPDQLRLQAVVLNPKGQPVKGQKVKVELYKRNTYSYRKRLIGGFYDYEDQVEYTKLDDACSERSNAQGIIACELKPGEAGDIYIKATAEDDDGNLAIASTDVWVIGKNDLWFELGPSDRMDLLPEKKNVEFGEQAKLQVRMPFREATALVTVEREGVLDHFIMPLSGKEPVITLPIKANYAPNVYVSVLAVRGRAQERFAWFRELVNKLGFKLEDKNITALVDLNKPAFKLGMAELTVGWKPNKLEVKVQTDRESYKVREAAKLKVKVNRADGGPLPADAEIALAAVDEGLLELKPNDTWKLLDKMMGKRGIEVYTATAQMQVVGKRHYGRKAILSGGGGGRQTARELFDTLLLWKGRVPLNPQGEAELEVPLNDSLTAFRLTAVAHASTGFFGTGDASIRTTQDVMLHAGLPPLIREGDRFKAVFTLRNASSRKLALNVKAHWQVPQPTKPKQEGGTETAPPWQELPMQSLELDAGAAKEVAWDMSVPVDTAKLDWEVSAESADGSAKDALKISQSVIPVWPVRVYQATLMQIDKPINMPVAQPEGAVPGRGGIRVSLRNRIGDGLAGVLDYMGRYPYSCFEQRTSKAIALRNEELWKANMDIIPAYLDSDGLLRYFPMDFLQGSDVLTSYVLSIAQEADWAIPEAPRERMLEALSGFVSGQIKRGMAISTADLAIRKLAAIETLARYQKAKPEMLDSISIDPNLWPTSAVLDWLSILKQMPNLARRDERLSEASHIIRSRLNLQGTTMGFSTEDSDRLWWLMVSIDENAVRALLNLLDQPQWKEDIPRMVTGAIGRQHHGHWDTTTANAWGTLALEKFSAAFEAVPVTGYTEAAMDGSKKGMQWTPETKQSALNFPWGNGPAELQVKHNGTGKPWAIVQSRAALPLKQPLFTGYSIKRSIEPVEQQQKGQWNKGDVARIKLEMDAQSDMTWVVVDDPVPAGATILGSGLGGDSKLLVKGEKQEGWVWPAYEERRFEAFRAYYEYVPKGHWSFEYTIRLNNPGQFELPATRVEALYAPEMFGELPNGAWEIH